MMTSARKKKKKDYPPPATLKFPFAVLRCLVRGGGGGGKGDLWHREGRGLNGSVCVHECVHVGQTRQETTRVDILFGRKHNKTHWNTVQEEQGVILKVNKQKEASSRGAFSPPATAGGEVRPTAERVMWFFFFFLLPECLRWFSTGGVSDQRVFDVSQHSCRAPHTICLCGFVTHYAHKCRSRAAGGWIQASGALVVVSRTQQPGIWPGTLLVGHGWDLCFPGETFSAGRHEFGWVKFVLMVPWGPG